jgi:hypothetical protein
VSIRLIREQKRGQNSRNSVTAGIMGDNPSGYFRVCTGRQNTHTQQAVSSGREVFGTVLKTGNKTLSSPSKILVMSSTKCLSITGWRWTTLRAKLFVIVVFVCLLLLSVHTTAAESTTPGPVRNRHLRYAYDNGAIVAARQHHSHQHDYHHEIQHELHHERRRRLTKQQPDEQPTLFEGELVRSYHDWTVYVYRHGTLYPIPDSETFRELGFSFNDVHDFPDGMLKLFPVGSPITSASDTSQNNSVNASKIVNSDVKSYHNARNNDRGVVLCAGARQIPDAMGVIRQFRHVFNLTDLNITIAHCNELSSEHTTYLKAKRVNELNMCVNETVLGMSKDVAAGRLRGFFCKAAALVLSPYRDTIISDLDAVFFKDPTTLFSSRQYLETGAIYFRDKPTGDINCDNNALHTGAKSLFNHLTEDMNASARAAYSRIQANTNGGSLFWRHEANTSEICYYNFQDSSLMVVDRARHPLTLHYLAELLPNFQLGYGDKEIYWISNTMAEEPFSFEPFLVSTYGDCGVLVHYDPSDVADPSNAKPLYINAEYIIEKIGLYGINLEFDLPNATLVTAGTPVQSWNFYSTVGPTGPYKSCSCYLYGCHPHSTSTNSLLLRAQWERISRGWRNHNDPNNCMNLFKDNAWIISIAMDGMIAAGDCPHIGCLYSPIYINASTMYQRRVMSFCDPVSFATIPPEELNTRAKALQLVPDIPTLKDLEIVKASGREVYMYFANDTSLHLIPNWNTFLRLGLDTSDIHGLSDAEIMLFNIGEDVWKGIYS